MKKIRVKLILPGGGAKGVFQAGFLYHLCKNYSENFSIESLECTSAGSINGLMILCGKYDLLMKKWLSFRGVQDIFKPWLKIYLPYVGDIISIIYGFFFKLGIFSNKELKKELKETLGKELFMLPHEKRIKFKCTVLDIEKGETKYVNGMDKDIIDYVTASASPWALANLTEINGKMYSDGGLLDLFPLKNLTKDNENIDLVVLLGYYRIPRNKKYKNVLDILVDLIDICRYYTYNQMELDRIIENTENKKIVLIKNPLIDVGFLDFENSNMIKGFKNGIEQGEIFADRYLK